MRSCARCWLTASGLGTGVAGIALIGVGLWARRETRRGLSRERIALDPSSSAVVAGPGAARSLAETIREITLESAGGRTYAETDLYVAADGGTTSDSESALIDDRTGQPVRNPDADLWIQSTTLQTALMQAYMAFRLADLSLAIGATLAAAGTGLAAAGRR